MKRIEAVTRVDDVVHGWKSFLDRHADGPEDENLGSYQVPVAITLSLNYRALTLSIGAVEESPSNTEDAFRHLYLQAASSIASHQYRVAHKSPLVR